MREYYVHQLEFPNRRAFVTVGDETWPDRLWQRRFAFESSLNGAMRESEHPPISFPVVSTPLSGELARALAKTIKTQLKAQGYKILSARNRATYATAGKLKPRPIYVRTPWGMNWFPSVAAAARATGKDPSTIILNAKDPENLDVIYENSPKR